MHRRAVVQGVLCLLAAVLVTAGVALFVWGDERPSGCVLFTVGCLLFLAQGRSLSWMRPQGGGYAQDDLDRQTALPHNAPRPAEESLRGSDEALAVALASLSSDPARMIGYDARFADVTPMLMMQDIGKELEGRGGHELMERVCNRAQSLGGNRNAISWLWDGIGEWRHGDAS